MDEDVENLQRRFDYIDLIINIDGDNYSEEVLFNYTIYELERLYTDLSDNPQLSILSPPSMNNNQLNDRINTAMTTASNIAIQTTLNNQDNESDNSIEDETEDELEPENENDNQSNNEQDDDEDDQVPPLEDSLNSLVYTQSLGRGLRNNTTHQNIFQNLVATLLNRGNIINNQDDVKLKLKDEEYDRLPKYIKNINYHDDNVCNICLEDYKNMEIIVKLTCNHLYHDLCINNWLANESYKCPVCRVEQGESQVIE